MKLKLEKKKIKTSNQQLQSQHHNNHHNRHRTRLHKLANLRSSSSMSRMRSYSDMAAPANRGGGRRTCRAWTMRPPTRCTPDTRRLHASALDGLILVANVVGHLLRLLAALGGACGARVARLNAPRIVCSVCLRASLTVLSHPQTQA